MTDIKHYIVEALHGEALYILIFKDGEEAYEVFSETERDYAAYGHMPEGTKLHLFGAPSLADLEATQGHLFGMIRGVPFSD